MKHTNYQFKLEETNSFGKEYCDDPKILRKFCNTKRPNEMWTEALSMKPKRKIYFENGKDLEECNLNQTLRQCDERAERCDKLEENRAPGQIKWSNYISLGHGLEARYVKSTCLGLFLILHDLRIFYLKIVGFVKDARA